MVGKAKIGILNSKTRKQLTQTSLILVKYNKKRGKGGRAVYARKNISRGTLIEWSPCLIIPEEEIGENWDHVLPWYVFDWTGEEENDKKMNALALGYVSLYNHSYDPNAYYEMEDPDCISIWALRDIVKGEEITINYNGDPEDQTEVGFKVIGSTPKNAEEKQTH